MSSNEDRTGNKTETEIARDLEERAIPGLLQEISSVRETMTAMTADLDRMETELGRLQGAHAAMLDTIDEPVASEAIPELPPPPRRQGKPRRS